MGCGCSSQPVVNEFEYTYRPKTQLERCEEKKESLDIAIGKVEKMRLNVRTRIVLGQLYSMRNTGNYCRLDIEALIIRIDAGLGV